MLKVKTDYPKRDKNINVRKLKNIVFCDTETIGSLYHKETIFPFDISLKVYDNKKSEVVKEKCYLVRKFFNNKYTMGCTFSAGKYPRYNEKVLEDRRYNVNSVREIAKSIEKMLKHYNIKYFVAHNGGFDFSALGRLFKEFNVKNPLEKVDVLDTMTLARGVISNDKNYIKFCLKNKDMLNSRGESKFLTNSGRVRETAESFYCYIIDNPAWSEEHTGLEDIDIEIKIFEYCRSKKAITPINCKPSWQDLQVVA